MSFMLTNRFKPKFTPRPGLFVFQNAVTESDDIDHQFLREQKGRESVAAVPATLPTQNGLTGSPSDSIGIVVRTYPR